MHFTRNKVNNEQNKKMYKISQIFIIFYDERNLKISSFAHNEHNIRAIKVLHITRDTKENRSIPREIKNRK